MANQVVRGSDAYPGYGREGEIRLAVDVQPWIKDSLVDLAEDEGLALKTVVAAALERYIELAARP